MSQLKRYDELIERAGGEEKAALATLVPGSVFTTTYVFSFKRGRADTHRYTVTIEASYVEEGTTIAETGSVSQSANISPSPSILSVIAVLSTLPGAILKAAVSNDPAHPSSAQEAFILWVTNLLLRSCLCKCWVPW